MSTASPLVSVIVPVYNVEQYLVPCLESLLNQTLKELEIIAVNDASPDRSHEILRYYASRDSRLKLIHHDQNQGLSVARNTALAAAQGKYIGFTDSDDWMYPWAFEKLAACAEYHHADLVQGNATAFQHHKCRFVQYFDQDRWSLIPPRLRNQTFTLDDYPDFLRHEVPVFRRLLRTDYLESLNFGFEPGLIFEDIIANYQWTLPAKRIAFQNVPVCFYRIGRPGQITRRHDRTMDDIFTVLGRVLDELAHHRASVPVQSAALIHQLKNLSWIYYRFEGDELRNYFFERARRHFSRVPSEVIEHCHTTYPLDYERFMLLCFTNNWFDHLEKAQEFCRRRPILDAKVKLPTTLWWKHFGIPWCLQPITGKKPRHERRRKLHVQNPTPFRYRRSKRRKLAVMELRHKTFSFDVPQHDNALKPLLTWQFKDGCAADILPLRPNDIVVDLGANVGLFSLPLALDYPWAEFHAFEPNADRFQSLTRNIEAMGVTNVKAREAELADVPRILIEQNINHVRLLRLCCDTAAALAFLNKPPGDFKVDYLTGQVRTQDEHYHELTKASEKLATYSRWHTAQGNKVEFSGLENWSRLMPEFESGSQVTLQSKLSKEPNPV